MFDRTERRSLWHQMLQGSACGPAFPARREPHAAIEISWEGWRGLHPQTQVVTGLRRDYRRYPFGDYERVDNAGTPHPMPSIDPRRPPKERVLGLPTESGGIAFPFLALSEAGPVVAVETTHRGHPVVVFWRSDVQAAAAFSKLLEGERLDFTVRDGSILDEATGSAWTLDGRALAGPLAGRRLEPVVPAYLAFWFAWASFQPETGIWEAGS